MSDTRSKLSNHIVDSYLLRHMSPAQQEDLLRRRAFHQERERLEAELLANLQDELLEIVKRKLAGQGYDRERMKELVQEIQKLQPQPASEEISPSQTKSKLEQYIEDFSGR